MQLSASFILRQLTTPPRRSTPGAFRRAINWTPSGNGAGVATVSHQVSVDIPASSSYELDLANFEDLNAENATWTALKACILSHDAASEATGAVKITGSATNALPGLRCSDLLAGQCAVPLFDPVSTGITITSPNSKIVIANADSGHAASVTLLLNGEG